MDNIYTFLNFKTIPGDYLTAKTALVISELRNNADDLDDYIRFLVDNKCVVKLKVIENCYNAISLYAYTGSFTDYQKNVALSYIQALIGDTKVVIDNYKLVERAYFLMRSYQQEPELLEQEEIKLA